MEQKQSNDSQQRMESFQKEYIALTEKYGVDFVSYPVFSPTPTGAYVTTIAMRLIDKKSMPVPSPIANSDGSLIKE